ncbi:MAG: AsmA-like C-terminal region-containing protein [Verrucomicrobiales bacterium]
MQNGALRLPAITGDFLGGGELTGQADVDLTRPGVPFKIDLTVKGGHLGALPKALLPADEVRGDVEGRLALSGYAEALETLQGGGLIRCADITAARSPDLDVAAAGAGEEKLKELAVDSAAALFQIAHRVVAVRDLTVKSEHAMLRALGQVAFDGRLNINARLYLTPEALGVAQRVESRLPPEQRLGFRALEDTDWHYRDTLVRGTAGQPAADLRGTGELRPLRDEIQALFAAEPAG